MAVCSLERVALAIDVRKIIPTHEPAHRRGILPDAIQKHGAPGIPTPAVRSTSRRTFLYPLCTFAAVVRLTCYPRRVDVHEAAVLLETRLAGHSDARVPEAQRPPEGEEPNPGNTLTALTSPPCTIAATTPFQKKSLSILTNNTLPRISHCWLELAIATDGGPRRKASAVLGRL